MNGIVKLKSEFISNNQERSLTPDGVSPDLHAARLVHGILARKAFYFQQRTAKLDMRGIGRVDIDRVAREVDIDTLQVHLENITFANVTEDDVRLYSDACFLNLFRLSQLLLEYLLSVQDTLSTSIEAKWCLLQALAAKYTCLRREVDRGRAELHMYSDQARSLKREVRQKRATIRRYEQLLALPAPHKEKRSLEGGGPHQPCLSCGKVFTTAEFLQQHIIRGHAQREGSPRSGDHKHTGEGQVPAEGKQSPTQLRLFIQASSGQCVDIMVRDGVTISQLRGYVNATAGSALAAPPKRVVYRGVILHDDETLRECKIPNESQLMVVDSENVERQAEANEEGGSPPTVQEVNNKEESAATEQMTTLVTLMERQLQWTMRQEHGRREHEMGVAEALEKRMRDVEVSMPRRLEEYMEEAMVGLKDSVQKNLDTIEALSVRRSNAGVIVDDDIDEPKPAAAQVRAR
ncbi:unnamed protein product [Discosporangium mesarthrocarpum]